MEDKHDGLHSGLFLKSSEKQDEYTQDERHLSNETGDE